MCFTCDGGPLFITAHERSSAQVLPEQRLLHNPPRFSDMEPPIESFPEENAETLVSEVLT